MAYAQLAVGEQRHDAKPGLVAEGLEEAGKGVDIKRV
jgi:hypothetical protein